MSRYAPSGHTRRVARGGLASWDGGIVMDGRATMGLRPAQSQRRPRAGARTRISLTARWILAVGLAVIVFLTTSIMVQAATAPGSLSFPARLAEAARDDGFGMVVDFLRQFDPH